MWAHAAARGTNDAWVFDRRACHEDWLSDHGGMRGSAGGATEVHTKVTMPIVVHMARETVCRIGAQSDDQCDGRDDREQTIAAKTCAQCRSAICWGNTRTDESHPFDRKLKRELPLQPSQKA